MAKNKIEIDVKVDDKGTTKKVALGAKQAAEGLDKTAKSANSADRNLKGAAQASANGTKNFSKMAQGMTGGLVPAYAVLAANIFAVSAAYQFLKRAGDLAALQASQETYALKTGTSLKLLTSRIQEATGGILGFDDAAQSVAIGRAAGLSADQLESLATIAKNASVTLGRDLTDSFNRLTRGAIKAEPELLDELGIIIRLDTAVKDYKNALNITGRELNTFEKSQAVVNAVIEQGVTKFDDIGNSVNNVARFGKAADDLIKSIQKGIVGPATFIADVFTKNIYALGAAAAIMGTSLIKAIAPAAPALANLDEAAASARKSLQGIAGTSAIGKEIAAGTFEKRQITAIENAQKAKTSKVINLSKMERNEIKRNLAIIKADHQRTMAANTSGFTRYVANAKAQLYVLQADHGRVMGTMQAVVGGFARFASKAMNAIAILGMITLAISMGKELLNMLKDPALKKAEERGGYISERFAAQNKEVEKLRDNLGQAKTRMESLVQTANLLANFSYSGIMGISFEQIKLPDLPGIDGLGQRSRGQGGQFFEVKEVKAQNEAVSNSLSEVFRTFELQLSILEKAGVETGTLGGKVAQLVTEQTTLNLINTNTIKGTNEYNTALLGLSSGIQSTAEEIQVLVNALNAQQAAIAGIEQTTSTFVQLQQKFTKPSSSLTQLVDVYKSLKDQLEAIVELGAGDKLGTFFDPTKLAQIGKVLGLTTDQVAKLTKAEVLGTPQDGGVSFIPEYSLYAKILDAQAIELRQLTEKSKIQKQYQQDMQSIFPFAQKIAEQTRQEALIQSQIQAIEDKKLQAKLTSTTIHPTVLAQMNAEKDVLETQLDTLQKRNSELGQVADTLGKSLESGLTSAFDSIIQGTASVKEAFGNMAMGILQALSKVITQLLVVKLLQAALGGTSLGNFLGVQGTVGQVSGTGAASTQDIMMGSFRYGGISKAPQMAAGGVLKGPTSGYPVTMHGTEAVVPLPNGKSIPVDMKGVGQNNNVVVNVSVDSQGNAQTSTQSQSSADAGNLGSAIARAVQQELQNQKRSGGILNPYGVA
jgi:hypothetical protein